MISELWDSQGYTEKQKAQTVTQTPTTLNTYRLMGLDLTLTDEKYRQAHEMPDPEPYKEHCDVHLCCRSQPVCHNADLITYINTVLF